MAEGSAALGFPDSRLYCNKKSANCSAAIEVSPLIDFQTRRRGSAMPTLVIRNKGLRVSLLLHHSISLVCTNGMKVVFAVKGYGLKSFLRAVSCNRQTWRMRRFHTRSSTLSISVLEAGLLLLDVRRSSMEAASQ